MEYLRNQRDHVLDVNSQCCVHIAQSAKFLPFKSLLFGQNLQKHQSINKFGEKRPNVPQDCFSITQRSNCGGEALSKHASAQVNFSGFCERIEAKPAHNCWEWSRVYLWRVTEKMASSQSPVLDLPGASHKRKKNTPPSGCQKGNQTLHYLGAQSAFSDSCVVLTCRSLVQFQETITDNKHSTIRQLNICAPNWVELYQFRLEQKCAFERNCPTSFQNKQRKRACLSKQGRIPTSRPCGHPCSS